MSYQIIILFVVFAIVIYFSIAELIWQLRNRHFRRRLLIGVLIAALLVSQIDFISLFAKTEAVIVSAAESDAEIASAVDTDAETGTGTESVEVSVIERLSDGIQMYTKTVGMALDEFIQSDAWKIDHILAMVEETEFFGDLVGEERTGDVEEEIPIEIEKDIEEGDLAETEKVTEEENPTETEKDIEEGNLSEAEKETEKEAEEENSSEAEKEIEEKNPAETEKDTEEGNPSEAEKEAEEENPSETEKDTEEENSIEAENNAEESLKEAEIQEETASGDKNTAQSVDNDVPFANADYDDHDTIVWTLWTKTDSLPSSTGNYYLEENVTLTSTWEVQGKVNLCLNNHTYTGPSSLVHVNANAALNIYDCKGKGSHETYTITYDPGTYGKGAVKKQTKFPGKDITLLGAIYTRTGYTQTGWATIDNGDKVYDLGTTYAEDIDITLYPFWEANTYKVTYVENGGTISDKSNYTEYTCGVGLTLPIPERDGYTFEGWYTNSKFSGKAVTEITDTDSGNKTFYAKWSKVVATYIITYKPGDFGEGQVDSQTKVHGKAVYLSKDRFIRSGFEQTGWIADDESKIYKLGESYKDNKDITLYPVWAKVYTITYNPGEPPEDATGDIEGEIDDKTKIEGVAAKLSTKTFTCSGYKQTGWIKEDGSKEYKLGGNYTDDEDVTLYPIWARSHKVTYNKNGGTITNESKYTSYAEGVGLTLPTPSKSGHTFMGWYTDQNFKGSAVSSITKKDKEDKTFYAKWEIISTEINENFDDAGGENIDNTPNTDEQTEADEEDIDEEDEDMEDESSLDDTDKSKNKRKEKDEEDEDEEEEDTDDLEELTENDEDDDMESSKVSTQSAEQAEMKSANRFVQAGLKNGKIVIIGNSSGSDGISTGGNGAKGESSGEEAANEFVRTETAPGEEYAATIIAVGEGSVIVTISSDEWQFGAGVADTVAVANAVLTAEHKQLVNDGENIEIRLVVKDISGQVPEKDKGIIEDGLNVGQEEEAAKLVPAAYIDISIDIRIGYGSWEAVTQTEEPIKVVVGISEEWSESGTFYIARAHESKYALLDDLDSESNTVTIMTELFSTYAVVYQQLPVITIDADPIYSFFTSHSWITVTWIGALLFIGVLEILLLIVILLLWKQYKKEKREAQREIVTP